jgi:Secretion system C-terminal sorting domain
MRKSILLSLGLCLGSFALEAQTAAYQSVFVPKNRWDLFASDAKGNGVAKTQVILQDTTMDGKTYMVFVEDGAYPSKNHVYLREDTSQRKVYAFEDGKEFLLYDFNLSLGDKFFIKQFEFEVVNIGAFPTIEGERKCIELKPTSKTWDNLKWIEGFGASTAPLYYKNYGKIDENSQVTCFFRNNKLVYSVSDWDCVASVSSKDVNYLAHNVLVAPNPFHGAFRLRVENPSSEPIDISVRTITGAVVFQQHYDNTSERFDTTLDLENTSNGIFLLTVTTSEGRATKRIVKE